MNIRRDWNEFWFEPRPSGPLGLFRVIFGFLALCWGGLLAPDLYTWYSERGVMPLNAMRVFNDQQAIHFELNLLNSLNVTDRRVLVVFFVVLMIAALFMMIGFFTRTSTILFWVLLTSFQHRDEIILNSGDIFMRIMCFYLMFAPAGAACSIDRMIRIWRGKEAPGDPPKVSPWAQRLMQIQVSIVYLATFLDKTQGLDWQNGTAIYFPLHMAEMQRFWMPFVGSNIYAINFLTYGTMATELSMGTLVWVPRLRGYVLAAATLLHLGIEYLLNIPLFSAFMISSYITFVPNEWIAKFVVFWTRVFSKASLTVRYADRGALPALAAVLSRMDILGLIAFVPLSAGGGKNRASDSSSRALIEVVDRNGVTHEGFAALRMAMWRMPPLWFKTLLCYLPGMVAVGDRWLAKWASRETVSPVLAVSEEPVSVRS
jgi:hypothetical protein